MTEPAIQLQGYEELLRKIKTLEELKPIAGRMKAAGAHIKGKLQVYPSPRHAPQPFKTEKQRRYFFYALAAGKIDVPYRRGQSPGSKNLKQSWTVRMYNSGLTAEVGTNALYAPLVQDRDRQAHYHQGMGWITIQDVSEQEGEFVLQYLKEGIDQIIAEDS